MAQGHMACGQQSEMEADRDVSSMSTNVCLVYTVRVQDIPIFIMCVTYVSTLVWL